MLKWLYHKIMPDTGQITNMKVQLNTKIKLDAKSYKKYITFITCERERKMTIAKLQYIYPTTYNML